VFLNLLWSDVNGRLSRIYPLVTLADDLVPVPIDSQTDPTIAYKNLMEHGRNYIPPVQLPPCPGNLKAFAIDCLPNYGCVCLVYNAGYSPGIKKAPEDQESKWAREESTSVWYKDRSCKWWYIAPDITSYLRLMIVHLCIVGWWGAYTDSDVDPGCKLLMRRFAPERMVVNEAFGVCYHLEGLKGAVGGGGEGGDSFEGR